MWDIQCAAGFSIHHSRLWNTGSPGPVYAKASTGHVSLARRSFSEGGKPGDDGCRCGARLDTIIASQRVARMRVR
jgi:hypothetical protein